MNSSTLKDLLIEYSKKRDFAISEVSRKKEELYSKFPRLKEIEEDLAKNLIKKSKLILTSNSKAAEAVSNEIANNKYTINKLNRIYINNSL